MNRQNNIRTFKLIIPILILLLLTGNDIQSDQQEIEQVEVRVQTISQVESLVPDHPGTFGLIQAVDFDRDGNLYVLDVSDALVLKLNPQMQLISCFGGKGHGPGELQVHIQHNRSHLTVGGDIVVVADNPGHLIHVYSLEGEYRTRFRPAARVIDIAVRKDSRIIVSTEADSTIAEYNPNGELIREYATALIPVDDWRYKSWRAMEISLLPDDRIALISNCFLIIRIYQDGLFIEENTLHLEDLYPVSSRDEQRQLENFLGNMANQTVDDIIRLARTGEDPRGLISSSSLITVKGTDEIWVRGLTIIHQFREDGHVLRVGRLPEEAWTGGKMAFHGDHFAIPDSYNATLIYGKIIADTQHH